MNDEMFDYEANLVIPGSIMVPSNATEEEIKQAFIDYFTGLLEFGIDPDDIKDIKKSVSFSF